MAFLFTKNDRTCVTASNAHQAILLNLRIFHFPQIICTLKIKEIKLNQMFVQYMPLQRWSYYKYNV